MRFKIVKASFDGICNCEHTYESIEEAVAELHCSKGWDSLAEMRDSIRRWAATAKAGDVFPTRVSAVVAVGLTYSERCPHCHCDGLDYGDISPVESGEIEQEVCCPTCSARWVDVFVLSEQRALVSR